MNIDFSEPTLFHCPHCNHESISQMKTIPGSGTQTCCCILCCLTCVLCPLPFFISNCKDKIHSCPVCAAQVGTKEFKVC